MTPGTSYLAALLLAGVLGWAAVGKLRRPAVTAAAFRELGLPQPARLAVAVPGAELAVAAALAVRPRLGALAALLLLAAFTILLAERLRSGSTVACGCFGTGRTEPISAVELARNGLLAAAAGAALGAVRPHPPALEEAVAVTAAAAAGLVCLALLRLRRDAGRLWQRAGGLG